MSDPMLSSAEVEGTPAPFEQEIPALNNPCECSKESESVTPGPIEQIATTACEHQHLTKDDVKDLIHKTVMDLVKTLVKKEVQETASNLAAKAATKGLL